MIKQSRRTSNIGSWWIAIDHYILAAFVVAIIISAIMVATASPAVAERIGLEPFYFIKRQLFFLFLGGVIMLLISQLSPENIKKISILGFICFFFLLILVLFIGNEIKGARRWISIGFFALQPSEFIKPLFSVITAIILMQHQVDRKFPSFWISTALYLILVLLIALQPDLGMSITISAIWGGQMFLAGLSMIWIILLAIAGVGGLLAAYTFLPHVTVRINSFLDPGKNENYQIKKSLEAFTNGGLTGTGPGEGVIKLHLPDSHTDFIFAVIGEELGLLAGLLVIALFAFMVFRTLWRVSKTGDGFSVLAVSGLIIQLGFQAVVNIGVTLHLLPTKGMTLPFISYGGSSMLSISIVTGMIIALTKKRFGVRHRPHFVDVKYDKG